MAASNNLASMEPWSFRPSSFPDSWISDAFSRDTEALTRALQQSLYSNNTQIVDNTTYTTYSNVSESSFHHLLKTEPVNSASPVSVSDNDAYPKRKNGGFTSNGKVTKRKSRASKRATTTFIAADPSNFRQMVQQVTGIQFGEMQMPVAAAVVKPEPHRPGNGNGNGSGNRIQNYGLPTLDTSECWLGRTVDVGPTPVSVEATESNGSVVLAGDAGSGSLSGSPDFGYGMFPTLESWQ